LTTVRFHHPAQQIVLQDYIDAVADAEARVERLTGQIAGLLPSWSLSPVVEAVQAMRGVAFIVAVTVVAEVGDFHRFDNPRQLMAYLGLTPSEHSSGNSVRRGGITKPLEVWYQDEARVGQQETLTRTWAERGTRPRALRDTRYTWAYIFGAVFPARATTAAWSCRVPTSRP